MKSPLGQYLEAAAVWLLFHGFALLPVDAASAVGGWLGRNIGARLPVSRRARRNLCRVFPDMPEQEREAILRGMWDNLGRVTGEYPHLPEFRYGPGERVEVEGLEHLLAMRDDGQPGLFVGGHIGNWELAGLCGISHGVKLHLIYRAANNPKLEWVYAKGRGAVGVGLIPKGASGARKALEVLRKGEHIAILVDQKMNDGIELPFFGHPAMTAPALASFALKFRCPVVPAKVIRLKGAHYRMTFEPPMTLPNSGDRQADTLSLMTDVNALLERWILANPEQWLWLHKRWKD